MSDNVQSSLTILRDQWNTVCSHRIFSRISAKPDAPSSPIVLVPGLAVSGRYMLPTARRLATRQLVAIPDFPGSGQSSNPDHTLTLVELADILAEWMTAIGIERATLLGNSFGCQIIVEFALRYPERIDRAILVGPSGDPDRQSAVNLLLRLARDGLHEQPRHVVKTLSEYWRFGMKRGIETFQIMINDETEKKLPRMTAPTLIVRGSHDPIISQEWVERMSRLLPHAELAVVSGAAHAVNDDDPEDLVDLVERFLGTPVSGA